MTLGGKINLYFPPKLFDKSPESIETHSLNINKEITCLEFCNPNENEENKNSDVLFIGSDSSLMCYDIMNNKTLFDKDVIEGVFCMACGKFSKYTTPLCLAGGNCNIIGVDITGQDVFWTVLGGSAICMSLGDVDKDEKNELMVGTDDFTIRFYKDEEVINEVNENTKIVIISHIEDDFFIYGLESGTFGLYKMNNKIWTKKEKGFCTSIICDDFNKDDSYEALIGMSTGKIIMFDANTGKEYLSTMLENGNPISKFFYGDFILNQKQANENEDEETKTQIICFTESGEVFGYIYADEKFVPIKRQFTSKDKKVNEEDLKKYEGLLQEKEKLLEELEELAVKDSNKSKINSPKDDITLPSDTKITIDLESNDECKCADLIIESTEGSLIKMVIIISEQIYKKETLVKYPKDETNKVIVQIKTQKDLNINLHIKVLVGTNYYLNDFQVFEFNKIIPKYCFYIILREDKEYESKVEQGITLEYNDRIDRLILFLSSSFNLPKDDVETFKKDDKTFRIRFRSLRTDKILEISIENSNVLKILTDEMELCGNLLQDLSSFLKVENMDANINYNKLAESYSPVFDRIEMLDRERNHFNINMTEIIGLIKDLFVKAEDNRLIDSIRSFKDYFRKIDIKNTELLDEFEKRSEKYNQLLLDLKSVNQLIQMASNLKVGSFKKAITNGCRDCIKKKDYKLLMKIISNGVV